VDLRRPALLGAGAALSLLAAVPAALSSAPGEVQVQALSGAPASQISPPDPVGLPGSTTTVPTSKVYGGKVRSCVLHIPDGLLAPAPLVIALHAHSQEPKAIRAYSRLEALADEQGFVVAFPEGASGSWNAGLCCAPSTRDAVDDVAFLDEVIAVVGTRTLIDPNRIAFTGGSNGAMMALRYACERPQVVASAAVVAGPLVAPCAPSMPVPVLVLHGAKDEVVPLYGGKNPRLGVTFPALGPSLEPFRKAGGEVQLQVVPRAGHEWMTRGRHGIDATRAIWSWMRDRPRVG
jgi:polyhydroxybutyrate depolymerase